MTTPVHIVDYDADWPRRFKIERRRLASATGLPHGCVQHFGSTAVPGLAAKPVIDILVAVDEPALLDVSAEAEAVPGEHTPISPRGNPRHVRFVESVTRCDFTYRGVNGLPGRLYFFRHHGQSAHVHVAMRDSWFVHDQLVFRDWLRAHPDDAAAYATLKRDLAVRFRHDRIAYTNAKAGFIRKILKQAGGIGPWLNES